VLRQAADFYSSSSSEHCKLRLAQWAYQQVGDVDRAQEVAGMARQEEARPPWFGV